MNVALGSRESASERAAQTDLWHVNRANRGDATV